MSPCVVTPSLTQDESDACRAYIVDSTLLAARVSPDDLRQLTALTDDRTLESAFGSGVGIASKDLREGVRRALTNASNILEERRRILRSAFAKSRLAKPLTVWAGHGDIRNIFGAFVPDPALLSSLVGHRYSYGGFISTSMVEEKALDNARGRSELSVVLEFELPSGHAAIDMTQFGSVGGGEFELLLNGGTFVIVAASLEQRHRLGRTDFQQVARIRVRL